MRTLGYILITGGIVSMGLVPVVSSSLFGPSLSPAVGITLGIAFLIIGIGLITTREKQVLDNTRKAVEETDVRGCPQCGSKAFTWGEVVAYGGVRFRKGIGLGKTIAARQCDQCGHIDLFTKTNAL